MHISKLLPTIDNAGRRLVLAEIVGEPVGVKLARRRHKRLMKTKISTDVSAQNPVGDTNSAVIQAKAIPEVTMPALQSVQSELNHETELDQRISFEKANESSTQFELAGKTESLTGEKAETALELNNAPKVNSASSINTQPSLPLPLSRENKEEDSNFNLLVKELGKEEE